MSVCSQSTGVTTVGIDTELYSSNNNANKMLIRKTRNIF